MRLKDIAQVRAQTIAVRIRRNVRQPGQPRSSRAAKAMEARAKGRAKTVWLSLMNDPNRVTALCTAPISPEAPQASRRARRDACADLDDSHNQRRRVVASAAGDGFVRQLRRAVAIGGPVQRPQSLLQLRVEKPVHEPVGAEEKKITRLVGHRANLGFDELVLPAQRLLQRMPAWMLARFALADFALPKKPAHMRIVVG